MINIYYIENDRQHLEAVTAVLEKNNYNVFPKANDWENELKIFIDFLHDQSSQERKDAIENLLLDYNPELLIIDVDLGCNSSGDGGDIYDNYLLSSKNFCELPVVYLTILGKDAKRINKRTRHVTKILTGGVLNAQAISGPLLLNMTELLTPPNNMGFFDRLLDSI